MLLKALVSTGIVIAYVFSNSMLILEPAISVVAPVVTPIVKKELTVLTNRGDVNRYAEMPVDVFNKLKIVGDRIGLPETIWYPIAMYESHGREKHNYVSKREDSRGIFQVNVYAHEHVDKNKLYEATYNAEYQMPALMTSYSKGKKLGKKDLELLFYVIVNGQKPDWKSDFTRNYIKKEATKYSSIISRNKG